MHKVMSSTHTFHSYEIQNEDHLDLYFTVVINSHTLMNEAASPVCTSSICKAKRTGFSTITRKSVFKCPWMNVDYIIVHLEIPVAGMAKNTIDVVIVGNGICTFLCIAGRMPPGITQIIDN